MHKRSYLLNRRRTYVLTQRHVRAVSCRHTFFHDFSKAAANVNVIDEPVLERLSEEEIVEEAVEEIIEEKPAPQNIHQEIPDRKTKEDRKAKKALKKAKKAQEKEEVLNCLINEPSINLFLMLTNPLLCMDKVSEVDYATLSAGQRFVMHVFKWLAVSACFALPIAYIININPFGFSRMNFTAGSMVALKFAVFGLLSEILMMYGISLICYSRKNPLDRARMVSIYTYGEPFETLLFILSAVVMYFNIVYGIALFIASIFTSIFIKCYGLAKSDMAKKRFVLAMIVFMFMIVALFFGYAKIAGADVIKIFQNIMNI